MDALRITGGALLSGDIRISGSKNASLPCMAAAMLADGKSRLRGTPDLVDIRTFSKVLSSLGAAVVREEVQGDGATLVIDGSDIDSFDADYDLVRTMRASILVLGPLLARFGQARVSLPGGCAIGARPIDQHLKALARMGAKITLEHGYVVAEAEKLHGAEIVFDMPTVGGTENLMLAASLAEGTTVLQNAAREPEIIELAKVLMLMGAEIGGAGTERITITGVPSLRPFDHRIVSDRIEFGTYLVAGAMAAERLVLHGGVPAHQAALIAKLRQSGATVEVDGDATDDEMHTVTLRRAPKPRSVDITTEPYPGFPTDMQAQLMALLAIADNSAVVRENIFENRFMHVAELRRLGANIRVEGGRALVRGVPKLSGTTVMATDLRASACLVLAGLVAEGETVVRRIYHLDRGYEHISEKLGGAGAKVERFKENH